MKTTQKLTAIIAFSILFLSMSCRKWEEPPGKGGGGGNKPTNSILLGKFIDYSKLDGCRWVFESNDGKKYEVNGWYAKEEIKEGLPAEAEVKHLIGRGSVCMVGSGIDVINVKYTNTSLKCKVPLKVKGEVQNKTLTIQKVWQEGNFLKMAVSFSGCEFNPIPLDLYWDGNVSKSNPSMVQVKLINQPKAQACEAYFMKEICFDISGFRNLGSSLLMQIEGYSAGSVKLIFTK